MSTLAKGPKAGQEPGPFARIKGDVAYMAAFDGSVVMHSEAEALEAAKHFTKFGRVCVFRIEVVETFEHAPPPPPSTDGEHA